MIVRLFEYLRKHSILRWGILAILTILFALTASKLSYKEDISDFLPLGTADREALSIYQDISGANEIIAIFENPDDEDLTVNAIDAFSDYVCEADSSVASGVVSKLDVEEINKIADFVYANIPYFLTEQDYAHIDSIFMNPDYVEQQLEADRELLLFPSGGLLSNNISRDPLNIFTPVVNRLSRKQAHSKFETYEGYIFSPDMSRAIVMINSPYGNSETENNSKLIALLEDGASRVQQDFPEVKIHLTGGPCIAVENAKRIKTDSMLAVTISVVLILLLLCYSFRSIRNISLIAISIAWGWLLALSGIYLIHSSISVIVIGISSIIIGIAVNYPLHLIDHSQHDVDIKKSLSEIVAPLVVGNITTIGAFFALIPLKSIALRDLGLFASLLLFGTILFVLVFLPHMVKIRVREAHESKLLSRLASVRFENNRLVVWLVVVLTCVFSWFSLDTEFDSDMSKINYMTKTQREDMSYFQSLLEKEKNDSVGTLYVVSSASSIDEALADNSRKQAQLDSLSLSGAIVGRESASAFIVSEAEQNRRLEMWREMLARYQKIFKDDLQRSAAVAGFSSDAFSAFYDIIDGSYGPKAFEEFSTLTNSVFSGNFSINPSEKRYAVVDKVYVQADELDAVKDRFAGSFDVKSMNGAIANSLTDDFNYIGIVCSAIVFIFLWLSFGRIELAIIAFIPMAVSWIWILGIMSILGIHFNIVNIILATFIFGQGDDYTIFITEGCSYEYAYRKPMLASYKNSIILSALIMFIGIGSLIVAKHPALLSLAYITIIGMFSVVFMAYLFPPLIFNWLTRSRGRLRRRPLTLAALLRSWLCGACWLIQLLFGYIIGAVLFAFFGKNERTESLFHRFVTACHRFDMKHLPGVRSVIRNPRNENFDKPCVIVCNHQSMLDPMYFMALSHKIIIVANRRSSFNPVIWLMFKWLNFYTVVEDHFEEDIPLLESYVKRGYSIAIYVEGVRNPDSSVLRFHKGAFLLAQRLQMDILPVYLHGVNNVMPIRSFATNKGDVTVVIGDRITVDSDLWDSDYTETTRRVHRFYIAKYNELKEELEKTDYFAHLVKERYLYKGVGVLTAVRKSLSKKNLEWVDHIGKETTIVIKNSGNGALAIIAALVHPEKMVIAVEEDENNRLLAINCAKNFVKNIRVVAQYEYDINDEDYAVYEL